MNLSIKGTNLKLTPSIYKYIDEKLNKDLEKYVPRRDASAEAWVEVGKTTRHHHKGQVFRAEMQIKLSGGQTIRSEAEEWDLRLAIDTVKDELQRELKKYKARQIAKYRKGARDAKQETKIAREAKFQNR